jgi:hypothetical protein
MYTPGLAVTSWAMVLQMSSSVLSIPVGSYYSFTRCIEDTPTYLNFGSDRGQVTYGEGIYVGYRYYEKLLKDVLYPFG